MSTLSARECEGAMSHGASASREECRNRRATDQNNSDSVSVSLGPGPASSARPPVLSSITGIAYDNSLL